MSMDKKKLLGAYLIYKAGQSSRKQEPEREYNIGYMSIGCMAVCAILGMLLAAVFIWIFK